MRLPISTKRLLVRALTEDDVADMHEVWGDPEVMRHLPSEPSPSLAETGTRVRRQIDRDERTGLALWAVEERASGRVVGCCGLFPVDGIGPDIEVAYHFARAYWNRGYATEAADACVRAGFQELGLPRVLAMAYPANVASQRVMEKIGMRRLGVEEHYGQELVVYGIEREA